MPNRTNTIYNELNLVPVGNHTQITGANSNVVLTAPQGACVLLFQLTTGGGNSCRVRFDGGAATGGEGFRFDVEYGLQTYYGIYNQEINVYLSSGATFDYQWARPIKGN